MVAHDNLKSTLPCVADLLPRDDPYQDAAGDEVAQKNKRHVVIMNDHQSIQDSREVGHCKVAPRHARNCDCTISTVDRREDLGQVGKYSSRVGGEKGPGNKVHKLVIHDFVRLAAHRPMTLKRCVDAAFELELAVTAPLARTIRVTIGWTDCSER